MSGALHERLARAARDHAEEPALEHGPTRLRYRELWELAGALADERQRKGDGSRTWCVLVSRSVWSYAMFVAAIRSAATFVPISRLDAPARVQAIARGVGSATVLSEPEDVGSTDGRAQMVPTGSVSRVAGDDRLPAPDLGPVADDVPYVMHTSGSTGVPKGVLTTDSNVLSYLDHAVGRFDMDSRTRFAANFELTFDGCVLEMLGTLTAGGTLVIPEGRENVVADAFVRGHAISHWFAVPSAIRTAQSLSALAEGAMPSLRWSLFCGEPITFQECSAWARSAPGSAVVNVYGPTETTVTIASYLVPREASERAFVPLGTFDPGVEVRLDDDTSELLVRGPQRCLGYHDRAMNDVAFVDDHGAGPGDVRHVPPSFWYRTGDRVEVDRGQYVYRGRLDRQVKIDGRRVEPGEVEAAIIRSPAVDAAIVLDVTVAGRTRLVAAYEGRPGEEKALLAALRQTLPAHMIPDRCVRLQKLPVNNNGKIDASAVRGLIG